MPARTKKTDAQLRSEVQAYLSGGRDARRTPSGSRATQRATTTATATTPSPSRRAGGTCAYHPIGAQGERWPSWLTDLGASPGAYVIRDKATREALYVGSAKNNLYATITRHFQQWRRAKKWWRGQYGRTGTSHDPGLVYRRDDCEVAAWKTTEDDRLAKETELIQRFEPRDNLVEHPDGELEEAPF